MDPKAEDMAVDLQGLGEGKYTGDCKNAYESARVRALDAEDRLRRIAEKSEYCNKTHLLGGPHEYVLQEIHAIATGKGE